MQETRGREVIDDCSNVNDLNVEGGNVKRCRENESVVVWCFFGLVSAVRSKVNFDVQGLHSVWTIIIRIIGVVYAYLYMRIIYIYI